jgi:hypothetical protein
LLCQCGLKQQCLGKVTPKKARIYIQNLHQRQNTGRSQKHYLISSSYKIKTYWNIFYKYGTADTLIQEIFNFPTRRQRAVKFKSNAAGAC